MGVLVGIETSYWEEWLHHLFSAFCLIPKSHCSSSLAARFWSKRMYFIWSLLPLSQGVQTWINFGELVALIPWSHVFGKIITCSKVSNQKIRYYLSIISQINVQDLLFYCLRSCLVPQRAFEAPSTGHLLCSILRLKFHPFSLPILSQFLAKMEIQNLKNPWVANRLSHHLFDYVLGPGSLLRKENQKDEVSCCSSCQVVHQCSAWKTYQEIESVVVDEPSHSYFTIINTPVYFVELKHFFALCFASCTSRRLFIFLFGINQLNHSFIADS